MWSAKKISNSLSLQTKFHPFEIEFELHFLLYTSQLETHSYNSSAKIFFFNGKITILTNSSWNKTPSPNAFWKFAFNLGYFLVSVFYKLFNFRNIVVITFPPPSHFIFSGSLWNYSCLGMVSHWKTMNSGHYAMNACLRCRLALITQVVSFTVSLYYICILTA